LFLSKKTNFIQLPPLPQKPNKGRDNPKSRNLLFKINDQFIQNQLCIFTTLYQFTHQSRYFVAFIPTIRS
jgi:hypothetical protein